MNALRQIVHSNNNFLQISIPDEFKNKKLEVIILQNDPKINKPEKMTAETLVKSNLVGIWSDRKNIEDSVKFSNQLRSKISHRSFYED